MATLTYDPAADPEVINSIQEDEQESMEIGERLEQEQNELLAGKFSDPEELEKAYLELQRKFSSRDTSSSHEEEEPTEQQEEEPDTEEEEEEGPGLEEFYARLAEEADAGEFSEDTLEAISGLEPAEVAQLIADARQQQQEVETQQPEVDVNYFYNMAGGEENYRQMTQWAAQNLPREEIEAFDSVVEQGDPMALYWAVQALQARFAANEGFEGELYTGKEGSRPSGFRSQAELIAAMDDPRYDSDPAYRADVEAMLERSNLQF